MDVSLPNSKLLKGKLLKGKLYLLRGSPSSFAMVFFATDSLIFLYFSAIILMSHFLREDAEV